MTQVVADVEVGVVDPDRAPLFKRHECQTLPVARDAVEPRLKEAKEFVVPRRLARENHDRRNVHVSATALEVKEGRVEAGKTVWIGHVASLMASVTNLTQAYSQHSTKRV